MVSELGPDYPIEESETLFNTRDFQSNCTRWFGFNPSERLTDTELETQDHIVILVQPWSSATKSLLASRYKEQQIPSEDWFRAADLLLGIGVTFLICIPSYSSMLQSSWLCTLSTSPAVLHPDFY